MFNSHPKNNTNKNVLEQGQALVEYALIAVLVGLAFGLAMAAAAPVTGNLFNAVVNDLLNQTVIGEAPNSTSFWLTVTKVQEFVPTGGALPTNTEAPHTLQPTQGPSLTPSPTYTPSPPIPTITPSLTRTPVDIMRNAPFRDTAENNRPSWWRTDSNIDLQGIPWIGHFFPNTDFSGAYLIRRGIWNLDYNGPFINDGTFPQDNFSARFERKIELAALTNLSMRVLVDDGVRMFVRTEAGATTPIVLTNSWGGTNSFVGQSATLYTGYVSLPPGTYYLVVEYVEYTGDSVLKVEVSGAGANPDDRAVDASGNTVDGGFSCGWNTNENERNSNSERYVFDDYGGASDMNHSGSLCYLEWRGAVVLPADVSQMQLVFWDVWEFDNIGVDGWLEVAEYIEASGSTPTAPKLNRAAMVWQKIDLNRAGTANFNWTRNTIDIAPLVSGFSSNKLAFRFAMKIPSGTTVGRQWFIDDVEFRNAVVNTYPVDKLWSLNDFAERADFLHTGGPGTGGEQSGWALVSNNKLGTTGFAYHDSVDTLQDHSIQVAGINGAPYTPYKSLSVSPDSNAQTDVRINALEINGWIDLTNAPSPDSLGNSGDVALSFYHGYDLGTQTGLAVQYATTPYDQPGASNWTTFPDGMLRAVTATGTARSLTLQEHIISLEDLPGNPSRIRIRFAMLVHRNAGTADGWWIDEIRLGRAEQEKWTNYPFFDDAQGAGPMHNWVYTGQWGPSALRGYLPQNAPGGYVGMSYGTSPGQYYLANRSTYMTLRWPLDLNNDTPDRVVMIEPGGATGTSNSFSGPAVDPYLTFMVFRELASGDKLEVQWRRANQTDANYQTLWTHSAGMINTNRNRNLVWEPVRVSLKPIMLTLTAAAGVGDLNDDDIYLRFALITDNSNEAPGFFIDNIRLAENAVDSHAFKLWPTSASRASYGTGNGTFFLSDPDGTIDGRPYQDDWTMGGQWASQNFERRIGALAFHDSVTGGQNRAPTGFQRSPAGQEDRGESSWYTPQQTYNVLELNRVIDLRGTDAETEVPRLNFWTRYHIGDNDYVRLEVSYRLRGATQSANDSTMRTNCGDSLLQCYEREYNWSPWSVHGPASNTAKLWENGTSNAIRRNYGWHRVSVNLSQFASKNTSPTRVGYEIRIRFVLDSATTHDNYDGWYIDNVELSHRQAQLVYNLNDVNYIDEGDLATNWLMEGSWGADPNISMAGANTENMSAVWTGRWWASSNTNLLNNPTRPAPSHTVVYTQINNNFGNGSPVAGWSQTDNIIAEFTADVTIDGTNILSGPRRFITNSDDGVRMKVERLDGSGNPIPPTGDQWNVINNWTNHSATLDYGEYTFVLGQRYRMTLQYFESGGGGVIQLSILDSLNTSYSDSPRMPGLVYDQPAIAYASTAMVGRQVFDLRDIASGNNIVLELNSKYRLASQESAFVEYSNDGGFTWSTSGMGTNISGSGFSMTNGSFSNTTSTDINTVSTGTWNVRYYNLTSQRGNQIQIRFRLDRLLSNCYRRDNCTDSNAVGNPSLALANAYYNGWWIGRIRINKL